LGCLFVHCDSFEIIIIYKIQISQKGPQVTEYPMYIGLRKYIWQIYYFLLKAGDKHFWYFIFLPFKFVNNISGINRQNKWRRSNCVCGCPTQHKQFDFQNLL